jgi:hypothetical protein
VLVTEAPGYVLRVGADELDAVRFERHATAGRGALESGDIAKALESLGAALDLWRGDAFADFAYESFAATEIARLHEWRAAAEEDRVEAMLIGGDHVGALAAVGGLVATYPLRERLRALQIRVLYSTGRQAEALRAFDQTRRLLAEELGLDPGRELQVLHRRVLEQDPTLDVAWPPQRRPAPTPSPSTTTATARRSAFVGRDDALAEVHRAVEEARAGRTRLALIEGEPGIGKTSLATEVVSRADASGFRACWGRCHDDEGAPPLWPWVQILRALEVDSDALPGHLRAILASVLSDFGATADSDLAPDVARFQLFEAVREVIERAASARPVILIVDDLQWADVSSQRLLRFLTVELHDVPLLLVATFRNTEENMNGALGDTLADVVRRSDVRRIVLAGLSQDDVAELIRLTTTVPEPDVTRIASAVHERTDGNPFFATEIMRLMQSEHRLDRPEATRDVPAAVSDVIRRRVGRLPDDVQTVLGVAAVIGRQFDLDVLAGASGLDAERTLDTLEAALLSRLVVQNAPARYQFAHALVRETLYSDLSPPRRVRLHGRVAATIESIWHADLQSHYHELAHHYGHSPTTVGDQALRYAALAAEQATARMAFDEAVALWRGALIALEHTQGVTLQAHARCLLELAAAERRAGNLVASATVHDQALAAARRLGDDQLLAEAAIAYGEVGLWQVRRYGTVDEHVVNALSDALDRLGEHDSTPRAQLLTSLAVALYYGEGGGARCQSLVRDAASIARRLGDTGLLFTSLVELIVMLDAEPDQTEQLAVAAELATTPGVGLPLESLSAAATRVARVGLARGDAAAFYREVEEFTRRATAARQPELLLWATWARTSVAFLSDRLDEAERLAGEAFALHQQLGIWGAQEAYSIHLVSIWREQGRMTAMAPLVEPLLAEFAHPGAAKLRGMFAIDRGALHEVAALLGPDPIPRTRDFTWLAETCITAELAATANLPCRTELYDLLLPFNGRVVTMDATFLCLGAVAHYLGMLAASLNRPDAARQHLQDAIVLNEAIEAAPWIRRSRAALADVEQRRSQRSEAISAASLSAAAWSSDRG